MAAIDNAQLHGLGLMLVQPGEERGGVKGDTKLIVVSSVDLKGNDSALG